MANSTFQQPHGEVNAQINFLSPPADGSAPFAYVENPPAGQPQQNYTEVTHTVSVQDVRGHEAEYNLDKDAFQLYQQVPSAMSYEAFDSDETVRTTYYAEIEKFLLENVAGAQKVVIFDHTIRRHHPNSHRQPVSFAHVDQTPYAAEQRVRHSINDPEETEKLLQGRYRIINVWRPLNGKVESMPLAFATATSVKPGDLSAIQRRYPNYTGETMGVKFNAEQKWLYWSGVDDDERILIKCSDSKEGVAARVPHSAFHDPRSPQNAKPRESIEVRTMVFG
ncbi:hypothetical protein ARAM_002824 [Aspergillus rambellii]|uniref:Methyltransferase n=1 Tax=Aspergillus rambellii TaxID=308745 RepID=A0A0F8WUE6_9EURO|nr:hypothetical protein ARAM_002824 [Aspergillus rambellii]